MLSGGSIEALLAGSLLHWIMEDAPYGDYTSEAIGVGGEAEMRVKAKTGGIAACTGELAGALRILGLDATPLVGSGSPFSPGDTLLRVRGDARTLLLIERVTLDLLAYTAGIATATSKLVEAARRANPRIVVAATRKTVPGLRLCSKRAFRAGGGDPYRWGLSDALIVKDSHVELVGSLAEAVKKALRGKSFIHKLVVEVSKPEDALTAARLGADVVMLDNMSVEEASEALRLLEEAGLRGRVIVEVSGGIGPDNIVDYASLGVDVVSTSYPFYRPERIDLSAEMVRP